MIVVPLSSGISNINAKFHKRIDAAFLSRESYARCDLVNCLEKNCLDFSRKSLGQVSLKEIWEIVRGIRSSIGDNPDL